MRTKGWIVKDGILAPRRINYTSHSKIKRRSHQIPNHHKRSSVTLIFRNYMLFKKILRSIEQPTTLNAPWRWINTARRLLTRSINEIILYSEMHSPSLTFTLMERIVTICLTGHVAQCEEASRSVDWSSSWSYQAFIPPGPAGSIGIKEFNQKRKDGPEMSGKLLAIHLP